MIHDLTDRLGKRTDLGIANRMRIGWKISALTVPAGSSRSRRRAALAKPPRRAARDDDHFGR